LERRIILKPWPEIPRSALAAFDAEIARDRKNKRLRKLGDSPAEAVATLKRLLHKRVTKAAVQAAIVAPGKT
jgi:hypothetical protein